MSEVHPQLLFNWDQTAIQFVPTGQWTMHRVKKVIPIATLDDKWQITAVLAVTITGEYLPSQLIYQGKMLRCHPKVVFPNGWDVWHSNIDWSNEQTMERYIRKVICPFITHKRDSLKLEKSSLALAIFDCFKGQTTPHVIGILQSHNIIAVQVAPNCTDKLQSLDVSLNKPMKDEMKRRFQLWYAEGVQKQLQDHVPLDQVKVEMPQSVMKAKSANWMISSLNELLVVKVLQEHLNPRSKALAG